MAKKARNYTFTSFEEEAPVYAGNSTYLVYGKEECPETKRQHWQGYAEFSSPKTISAAQKTLMIGKAHVEPRRGTPSEAAGYCKKGIRDKEDETGWALYADDEPGPDTFTGEEFGERMKDPRPGERVDIIAFKEAIKRGASDADLLDNHTACVAKYQKMIGFARCAYSQNKEPLPFGSRKDMGIWVWGAADIGKSRNIPVQCYAKSSNKWWCNYRGEDFILIDDPYTCWSSACVDHLKNWVTELPFDGETKGGEITIRFKKMIITCNKSMRDYFGNAFDPAIEARFTEHYVGTTQEVKRLYIQLKRAYWFDPDTKHARDVAAIKIQALFRGRHVRNLQK